MIKTKATLCRMVFGCLYPQQTMAGLLLNRDWLVIKCTPQFSGAVIKQMRYSFTWRGKHHECVA